jgi:hydrogenase maturation protease
MTTRQPRTILIGVGNPYRSDDGVGIAVVRQVGERNPTGLTVIESSGEGAALLEAWNGFSDVILVDAVQSGAPPGTIHRLDAHAGPIPSRFFHYSTHAFSVAEAVELARALNQLPSRLVVYGIEGRNFAAGESLSAEVEEAVVAVISRIFDDARNFAEGETPCTNSP